MQLFYNELTCWVRGALPVGHWHFVWVTDDKSERFVCLRVCHGEDQSCQAVIASFEIKPPFTRGPGRSLLTGISWLWFCSSAKALSALPAQGTAVWQLEQGTQLWASSGEKQTQVSLLVFYVQAEVVMEHHPCSLVENNFIFHIFTTPTGVCRKRSVFSGHWRKKRGRPLAWGCCRMFPHADDVWEI